MGIFLKGDRRRKLLHRHTFTLCSDVSICTGLMAEAREQLRLSEGNAAAYQQLDSRLERMRMELEEMHFQALEVRVQVTCQHEAVESNLDSPFDLSVLSDMFAN